MEGSLSPQAAGASASTVNRTEALFERDIEWRRRVEAGFAPRRRESKRDAQWCERPVTVAGSKHPCRHSNTQWRSSPVHPVQRRADDDQRHSAIDDGVAHQVNLTFIGQWAEQAQRLSPEDARDTDGGKSEGVSRRSLHRRSSSGSMIDSGVPACRFCSEHACLPAFFADV